MSSSKSWILLILVIFTFLFVGYWTLKLNSPERNRSNGSALGTKTTSVDGKQIVELKAKVGYSPSSIKASANEDTILRVTTDSTFDCSSALNIPKLNIRKNLPPTGTTDIPLGSQAPGTKLAGTCAMGMYYFNISFN